MSKERKVMLILDIIFTILTAVVVIVMQATEGRQSEIAKELFEDMYKLNYRLSNDEHYTIGDMIWDIDELKKKYTDINQRKEDEKR